MKELINGAIMMLLLISVVSCTSLSEGGSPDPLPNPDHDRRVQYNNGNLDNTRRQMNSQSSVINRKKNIEESHSYGPATTPTMERPQRIEGAPIDSTSHRPAWPLRSRIEPEE